MRHFQTLFDFTPRRGYICAVRAAALGRGGHRGATRPTRAGRRGEQMATVTPLRESAAMPRELILEHATGQFGPPPAPLPADHRFLVVRRTTDRELPAEAITATTRTHSEALRALAMPNPTHPLPVGLVDLAAADATTAFEPAPVAVRSGRVRLATSGESQ